MPILSNPRHERFAQELAKGKSQADAYVDAGYKGDRTAACRLSTKDNVIARIAELQGRGAARAEITVETLLVDAERIQRGAEADSQWAAANSTLQTKAKLSGKWVDKTHIEHTGANGGPIETADVSARELVERRLTGLATRGAAEGSSGRPH